MENSDLRIATVNLDTTVGNMSGNATAVRCALEGAMHGGAQLVAFPELVFGGYGAEDYWTHPHFVQAQLRSFAALVESLDHATYKDVVWVVGLAVPYRDRLYNCAVVLVGTQVLGVVPKEYLPNSNVFHEKRVFTLGKPGMHDGVLLPGIGNVPFGDLIFEFPWGTLSTAVCEDKWQLPGPVVRRNALISVVLNGSPGRFGMQASREQLMMTLSAATNGILVDTNVVGGNDGIVFDGGGFVVDRGRMVLNAPRFVEGVAFTAVDLAGARAARYKDTSWRTGSMEETSQVVSCTTHGLYEIRGYAVTPSESHFVGPDQAYRETVEMARLGLEDYVKKSGCASTYLIAVSGGLDSLLAAMQAHDALTKRYAAYGPEERAQLVHDHLVLVSLPTANNSQETIRAARFIGETLGATFLELPIDEEYQARMERLRVIAAEYGRTVSLLLYENVQPRIRGALMWDLATLFNGLWLHTGNMSEKGVGYTTVGGDNMGGFSPVSGLLKSFIKKLVRWYRRERPEWEAMIDAVLQKPASAELRPDQEDERDLMPMEVLDACIELFFGEQREPLSIYRELRARWSDEDLMVLCPGYVSGMLKGWVRRFFTLYPRAVFKWPYAPLGIHYGNLDLDRERAIQIPVAASTDWLRESLDAITAEE